METTPKEESAAINRKPIDWQALRAAFPYEAHGVIPTGGKSRDGKKVQVGLFLDARDIMNRLDEVIGPERWQDSYTDVRRERWQEKKSWFDKAGKKHEKIVDRTEVAVRCHLKVQTDASTWIERSDFGIRDDEKGAATDAFKRAAVHFGIGRYLYHFPKFFAPVNERGYIADENAAKAAIFRLAGEPLVQTNGSIDTGSSAGPAPKERTDAVYERAVSVFGQGAWALHLPRTLKQYGVKSFEDFTETQLQSFESRLSAYEKEKAAKVAETSGTYVLTDATEKYSRAGEKEKEFLQSDDDDDTPAWMRDDADDDFDGFDGGGTADDF
jgi:hypothetical protein